MQIEIALRPDEKVVREFTISSRLFWSLIVLGVLLALLVPTFLFAFLSVLAIEIEPIGRLIVWLIGFGLGLVLLGYAFYFRAARSYVLTDQRLIETRGWLSRRTISSDYEQITDIRVTQDVFERLVLGTGRVAVNTAGADIEEIQLERVSQPYQLSNQIRQLCEARLQATGRSSATATPAIREGPRPAPTGPSSTTSMR